MFPWVPGAVSCLIEGKRALRAYEGNLLARPAAKERYLSLLGALGPGQSQKIGYVTGTSALRGQVHCPHLSFYQQPLTHSRHSKHICWMHEWKNEWMLARSSSQTVWYQNVSLCQNPWRPCQHIHCWAQSSWFNRLGMKPENLHFWQVSKVTLMLSVWDHTLRTTDLQEQSPLLKNKALTQI